MPDAESNSSSSSEARGEGPSRALAAQKRALAAFVAHHARAGCSQRGADWTALIGTTVGGSELGALAGVNDYSTFFDVVAEKVAAARGSGKRGRGGEACWWGILFEDALAAVVGADLGDEVVGDALCLRGPGGQRYSPDGYLVAHTVASAGDGGPSAGADKGADKGAGQRPWRLWTTGEGGAPPPGAVPAAVLLEFKCPFSRAPEAGRVPPSYRLQVQAGLAACPFAGFAVFVDALIRKCGVAQLGGEAGYDEGYHRRDGGRFAEARPFAWGLIALCAPRGGRTPARFGAAAPRVGASLGLAPGALGELGEAADLGGVSPGVFYYALRDAAGGEAAPPGDRLTPVFSPPAFAGGRGGRPPAGAAELAAACAAAVPAGLLPVGVVPWKLLRAEYVPVARRPRFRAEVGGPLAAAALAHVAAACAAADPEAYLAAARRLARGRPPGGHALITPAEVARAAAEPRPPPGKAGAAGEEEEEEDSSAGLMAFAARGLGAEKGAGAARAQSRGRLQTTR